MTSSPIVPRPSDFRATRMHRTAGGFVIRRISYPAGERMPSHAHSHSSVTLVLGGRLRESVGGRDEVAGPLSVVVKPAGVVHSDAFGPRGTSTLQIRLPAARDDEERWLEGWRWHHGHAAVREFLSLAEALDPAGAGSGESMECRVWEVLGALSASRRPRETGGAPRWLLRVKEKVDDRLTESLRVHELAEGAGVHPVSVTRAFRRHFGETVTGYRSRERLRRAVGLLLSSGGSISRVAHASGFADHAHFCREFRRLTGVAPSTYRRLAGGGARARV